MISNIHTHLSEHGFVVIQVPNALSPFIGHLRYADFTHTVLFTPFSLQHVLMSGGATNVSIRPNSHQHYLQRMGYSKFDKLYRCEFGKRGYKQHMCHILTPEMIAVCFKNETSHNEWLAETKPIKNRYKKILGIF
jgi:hypothetical protein